MSEKYSLISLEREKKEMQKDFIAFSRAYDLLKMRLLESNDADIPRRPLLHEWSGSQAVTGALELSIHAIERTIIELDTMIFEVRTGSIANTDILGYPQLGVVDGGKS